MLKMICVSCFALWLTACGVVGGVDLPDTVPPQRDIDMTGALSVKKQQVSAVKPAKSIALNEMPTGGNYSADDRQSVNMLRDMVERIKPASAQPKATVGVF